MYSTDKIIKNFCRIFPLDTYIPKKIIPNITLNYINSDKEINENLYNFIKEEFKKQKTTWKNKKITDFIYYERKLLNIYKKGCRVKNLPLLINNISIFYFKWLKLNNLKFKEKEFLGKLGKRKELELIIINVHRLKNKSVTIIKGISTDNKHSIMFFLSTFNDYTCFFENIKLGEIVELYEIVDKYENKPKYGGKYTKISKIQVYW